MTVMTQDVFQHPKTVMSGMRPTGKLHLGHYVGVLKNWVQLQNQYPCYFMIADWHALTTKATQTDTLRDDIHEIVLDWLAAGIDPGKATIYVQSAIPEIAELHLLLSMLTPNKWVETDPTLKDMVQMMSEELNYGLLGYPVLQTADILMMQGNLVPVGKDQLAHLEISRDIARRFNHITQTHTFDEPRPLLTHTPLLMGLDGRKMGKSYGNGILISDTEEVTWKQLKGAVTDRARTTRDIPGQVSQCEVVYPYHQVFSSQTVIDKTIEECHTAARGCMDCKKILLESILDEMAPVMARRQAMANDLSLVEGILKDGNESARERAAQTMTTVRRAMKLYQP